MIWVVIAVHVGAAVVAGLAAYFVASRRRSRGQQLDGQHMTGGLLPPPEDPDTEEESPHA